MYKLYTKHYGWKGYHRVLLLAAALVLPNVSVAGFRSAPQDCEPLPPPTDAIGQAVEQFHQELAPTYWSEGDRLKNLMVELNGLSADGLEPSGYYLTTLEKVQSYLDTWDVILPCDALLASHAYISALADLRYGRQETGDREQIWYSPLLGDRRKTIELVRMARLGLNQQGVGQLDAAFNTARPSLPRYINLRNAYLIAREHLPSRWPVIPDGPTMEQGDLSPRVQILKLRLRAEGYLPIPASAAESDALFDSQVTAAVREFQRRHHLDDDGKVGPRTLLQLNISPSTRLEQIRTNLERMRWLAADMEDTLLLVDIAAARIEFYRNGEVVWTGRAQVGQPLHQTPKLKSLITHVTVNPSWTIPTSIFLRDQLPKIQRDPDYLSDRNMRIYNYSGDEVPASDVNWNNPNGILLRQAPGPNNALGEVVIRFSNPFAVYLHDTPSSWLFNTTNRFYSNGCVRVEDAMELTWLLFKEAPRKFWQELEAVRMSGETRNVHLYRSIPVLMAYWTAEASPDGTLFYRPDTYQDDQQLLAELTTQGPGSQSLAQ